MCSFLMNLMKNVWTIGVPFSLMLLFVILFLDILVVNFITVLLIKKKTFKTSLVLLMFLFVAEMGFYLVEGMLQRFHYSNLSIGKIENAFVIIEISVFILFFVSELGRTLVPMLFQQENFSIKNYIIFLMQSFFIVVSICIINTYFFNTNNGFLGMIISKTNSVTISVIMIVYLVTCHKFLREKDINIIDIDLNKNGPFDVINGLIEECSNKNKDKNNSFKDNL